MPSYIVITTRWTPDEQLESAFVADLGRRRAVYFGAEGRDPSDPGREKSTVAKAVRDLLCARGRLDHCPPFGQSSDVVICAFDVSRLLDRLAYLCAQPRHGAAPLPPWIVSDSRVVLEARLLVPRGWDDIAKAYAPATESEAEKFRVHAAALCGGSPSLSQEAAMLVYLLGARGYIQRPSPSVLHSESSG